MQIKKASVGWMMPVVILIVLAVLSVSAVFAYTSKLSFNMPVSFKIQDCTIKYENEGNDEIVFSSNQEETSSNFAVKPIADSALEISCEYSKFTNNTIAFSVSSGFTLELTKLVIYDAIAFDESVPEFNNSTYVGQSFASQILTITLYSGLAPESADDVVFCIRVLQVLEDQS